jgi:hypothetical protein
MGGSGHAVVQQQIKTALQGLHLATKVLLAEMLLRQAHLGAGKFGDDTCEVSVVGDVARLNVRLPVALGWWQPCLVLRRHDDEDGGRPLVCIGAAHASPGQVLVGVQTAPLAASSNEVSWEDELTRGIKLVACFLLLFVLCCWCCWSPQGGVALEKGAKNGHMHLQSVVAIRCVYPGERDRYGPAMAAEDGTSGGLSNLSKEASQVMIRRINKAVKQALVTDRLKVTFRVRLCFFVLEFYH